jgi:thiamine pyrophosphate-dependent acetolactate synthase large subunit-like protein
LLDPRIRVITARHEQGAAFMADSTVVSRIKPARVFRRWRPYLIEACAYDGPVVIDCPVDYSENMKLTERLRALGNV